MWRRVSLVRTDVSEERTASIIRVTIIGKLRLLVTANVPSSPILFTLWWKRYMPPKRRFLQESQDVTSEKAAFSNRFLIRCPSETESLPVFKHHHMKTSGGVALGGGEWSTSRWTRFPQVNVYQNPADRRLVPPPGLFDTAKKKDHPLQEMGCGSYTVQPATQVSVQNELC
jgi:hypothetical protein